MPGPSDDPDDQRWHAVATTGTRPGYFTGDRVRPGGAEGDQCTIKIFNVGFDVRELSGYVKSRRSSPTTFAGCAIELRHQRPRQPQLSRELRQDSYVAAGFRVPVGRETRRAKELPRGCSPASRCRAETFEFRAFTRLKQLEYSFRTKQIDKDFYLVVEGYCESRRPPRR